MGELTKEIASVASALIKALLGIAAVLMIIGVSIHLLVTWKIYGAARTARTEIEADFSKESEYELHLDKYPGTREIIVTLRLEDTNPDTIELRDVCIDLHYLIEIYDQNDSVIGSYSVDCIERSPIKVMGDSWTGLDLLYLFDPNFCKQKTRMRLVVMQGAPKLKGIKQTLYVEHAYNPMLE
jgi:hypothetical protein